MTEDEFLGELRAELAVELGHEPEMHGFKEIYFEALEPNDADDRRDARGQGGGLRMALLTNNVREWEPLWRSMLPVDEIFELVVDSAFVGMRKPEPEIYQPHARAHARARPGRLGDLEFSECLFVDDVEVNCTAARELGMNVVHFRSNDQAIPEIREALWTP